MLLWWVSCLGLHAAAIDARIPCGECPLWWCCWRVVLVLRVGDCGRRSALAAILTIVAAALNIYIPAVPLVVVANVHAQGNSNGAKLTGKQP
jgi:hypothetical protein